MEHILKLPLLSIVLYLSMAYSPEEVTKVLNMAGDVLIEAQTEYIAESLLGLLARQHPISAKFEYSLTFEERKLSPYDIVKLGSTITAVRNRKIYAPQYQINEDPRKIIIEINGPNLNMDILLGGDHININIDDLGDGTMEGLSSNAPVMFRYESIEILLKECDNENKRYSWIREVRLTAGDFRQEMFNMNALICAGLQICEPSCDISEQDKDWFRSKFIKCYCDALVFFPQATVQQSSGSSKILHLKHQLQQIVLRNIKLAKEITI